MDKQIVITTATNRNDLLAELMKESKSVCQSVILVLESVPAFINTQVSLAVFSAMLKGYPKPLYWYSSNLAITNFLKTSNVLQLWKPPISKSTASASQPIKSIPPLVSTPAYQAPELPKLATPITNSSTPISTPSIPKPPIEKEGTKPAFQPTIPKAQESKSIVIPPTQASKQKMSKIQKDLNRIEPPDFNNLDDLIHKIETTKQALEQKHGLLNKSLLDNEINFDSRRTFNWLMAALIVIGILILLGVTYQVLKN